nr:MAG TPA: hypothetical protein [Caudoviricetes sp.]
MLAEFLCKFVCSVAKQRKLSYLCRQGCGS